MDKDKDDDDDDHLMIKTFISNKSFASAFGLTNFLQLLALFVSFGMYD